jgi:hypothetical protein
LIVTTIGEDNQPHIHLIKQIFFVLRLRVMVLNATLSNISVISWQSVLLVEETRVFGENHQLATNH